MKDSGIYKISCIGNGKCYVGSGVSISKRWKHHIKIASAGKHGNRYFQRAWDKYGSGSFTFEILEEVADAAQLIAREQAWMYLLCATDPARGMNLAPRAGSNLGLRFSAETKQHLSEIRKGKKLPQAWREAIAAGLRGKTRPQAVKDAVSRANTGRRPSDEARRKMSAARKGAIRTPEQRQKISAALKGKPKSAQAIESNAAARRLLTSEQIADAAQQFVSGESLNSLAMQLGISAQTLANNFTRVGFNYKQYLKGRKFICEKRIFGSTAGV